MNPDRIPSWKAMVVLLVLAALLILGALLARAEPADRNVGGRVVFAYSVNLILSPGAWDNERGQVRVAVLDRICEAVDARSFARAISRPPHIRVLCIVPNRRPEA